MSNEEQMERAVREDILAAYRRHLDKGTAEFHEVRRSLVSKQKPDIRANYLGMSGRISVASLLGHLATIAPHVKPEEMLLNWATVVWYDAATEEEKVAHAEAWARHEERTREWERRQLLTLAEKHPDLVVVIR